MGPGIVICTFCDNVADIQVGRRYRTPGVGLHTTCVLCGSYMTSELPENVEAIARLTGSLDAVRDMIKLRPHLGWDSEEHW